MKAIEVLVMDPQTDRPVKSIFDASVLVGVQEYKRGGMDHSAISVPVGILVVAENYESLRKRWLAARDDQEVIPLELPKKPLVVQ